ncbi:MAG: PA14 domain-containing protein [Candidatus Diapherotrites archaeon]|nr:PA14 domain-containing protein [Candidatus Diapherotrites archaeon]
MVDEQVPEKQKVEVKLDKLLIGIIVGIALILLVVAINPFNKTSTGQATLVLANANCQTVNEPYEDTENYTDRECTTTYETYYVPEPYTECNNVTVQEPYQDTVRTQWNLTWYGVNGNNELMYDGPMGTQTWDAKIDYDWAGNPIYNGEDDYIGFVGNSRIYVPTERPVQFVLGSDDGSILYVDGQVVISNWGSHSFYQSQKTITLSAGYHNLELRYYQTYGNSRLYFDTDDSVIEWQETKTRPKTEQRCEQKTRQTPQQRPITSCQDVTKTRPVVKYREVEKCE